MRVVNAVRDVRTIRRLLTGAEAEARRSGEETPGPEHLLLAAAALPDGTALRALARVGVAPEQLRSAVEAAHVSALAAVGVDAEHRSPAASGLRGPATGVLRSTPQAQQVFQEAVALSTSTRPALLQGAHVVAAACAIERGTAIRALTALGVDRDRLRDAARAEVGLDVTPG
ncbi:Clp protease N-terminal domain-containing protein [Geodermatophilus sp. CPCC 205506]|uniref:Clp protease N-terminal domain-containing protein n=1 Tax=Geodermatophilus sp. CPCC 205506 TaxID=2936596 RepID=UPI003EEE8244